MSDLELPPFSCKPFYADVAVQQADGSLVTPDGVDVALLAAGTRMKPDADWEPAADYQDGTATFLFAHPYASEEDGAVRLDSSIDLYIRVTVAPVVDVFMVGRIRVTW